MTNREASAGGDSKNKGGTELLGPSTDFYKKMALDCSGQQIAVDLFAMGSQYADIASLSGISKFSGGQVYSNQSWPIVLKTLLLLPFGALLLLLLLLIRASLNY